MSIMFRPAVRQNVGLLIGLAGSSGSGKTYTAMRLAKGMAGDTPFLLMASRPGVPLPIKLQEQHRALVPLDQPITETCGQRLAAWARGGSIPKSATPALAPQLADLLAWCRTRTAAA